MNVKTEITSAKIRHLLDDLTADERQCVLACITKKNGFYTASNLIANNYNLTRNCSPMTLSDAIEVIEKCTNLEFQDYLDLVEDPEDCDNEYFIDASVDFEEELYLMFGEPLCDLE